MMKLKKLLFKDEAVIGIKKVTDYRYVKTLRFNLVNVNAWPGKEIGENHLKYGVLIHAALLLILIFCFVTAVTYMKIHSNTITMYESVHLYLSLFMNIVSTSRLLMTIPQSSKYKDVTSTFFKKMHLLYYKDVSEYAMKTHKQIHLISHLFTIHLTVMMYFGILVFNLIPMWNNYSSGKFKHKILYNSTYEHAFYFSVPLNIYTHYNAYWITCIYNWLISYLDSTLFCMLDLLLSLMVFNLWGHLKILLNDLDSFPLPAAQVVIPLDERNFSVNTGMYSEEELKQVSKKLKQCIDYHRLIVDFTNKMSDAFGPMLLIYYIFHQVSGCLLLFECSQMTAEALIRYVPLSILLFQQLIQLSVIFELIGSTSEKLKDAVYSTPWQYMDTKNRKIIAIFLINVKEPIHVKALGVVNVGVTSMTMIIKTSLSYFTFLRSM